MLSRMPLRYQIWISFAMIAMVILLMLSILLPITLGAFFTREIFTTIHQSQDQILRGGWKESLVEGRLEQQNIRAVRHFILTENRRTLSLANSRLLSLRIPPAIVEKIKREAAGQRKPAEEYRMSVNGTPLLYVIQRGQMAGTKVFLVSYMLDTYLQDSVRALFFQIMGFTFLALLILWLPSIWFAKRLSSPLVKMEREVKRIAGRDLEHPIRIERKDEIGSLASSIEQMRIQLKEQDELQKSFLQHVSHELKTPVMVIRSYAQSIEDGIFPKGDLASSVAVIAEEGERLEKRVRDLLYLTKLDYLSLSPVKLEEIRIDTLIYDVVDRLSPRRKDLDWEINLPPIKLMGDREQISVLFENLIENQIRYARKCIWIDGEYEESKKRGSLRLHIGNDGPPIPGEEIPNLFLPFQKGKKGEFGLGLAIVKRIVDLYGGKVEAENRGEGVFFHLELPNPTE